MSVKSTDCIQSRESLTLVNKSAEKGPRRGNFLLFPFQTEVDCGYRAFYLNNFGAFWTK